MSRHIDTHMIYWVDEALHGKCARVGSRTPQVGSYPAIPKKAHIRHKPE